MFRIDHPYAVLCSEAVTLGVADTKVCACDSVLIDVEPNSSSLENIFPRLKKELIFANDLVASPDAFDVSSVSGRFRLFLES